MNVAGLWRGCLAAGLCLGSFGVAAAGPFFVKDSEALRAKLGLQRYSISGIDSLRERLRVPREWREKLRTQGLKIAVLDNGFASLESKDPGVHGEVPPGTQIIRQYEGAQTLELDPKVDHGALTARTIWAMTDYHPDVRMRLFNAHGQTNLLLAMEAAEQWRADIVYIGVTYPTLGNFTGTGRLNDPLNRAAQRGTLVIVPAGNERGSVHNGPLKTVGLSSPTGTQDWLQFNRPDSTQSHWLRFTNDLDETDIQITASWTYPPGSDFTGTDLDLDLHLYQEAGGGKKPVRIASSERRQVQRELDDSDTTTVLSHETLRARLPASGGKNYLIALRHRGGKPVPTDFVRITLHTLNEDPGDVSAGPVQSRIRFLDATQGGEIMTLADSFAITVGDMTAHSSRGPTRDGRSKPDVLMYENTVLFTDNRGFSGTTFASALFAGAVASIKLVRPDFTPADILALRRQRPSFLAMGLSLTDVWAEGLDPAVYALLSKHYPVGDIYASTSEKRFVGSELFMVDGPGRLPQFRALPASVQQNPERFAIFLHARRVQKTRTVRVPEQIVRGPDREVVVLPEVPGRFQRVTRYRREVRYEPVPVAFDIATGQVVYRLAERAVSVPYEVEQWIPPVPAVKRTVPGEVQVIPGYTKTEVVANHVELELAYHDPGSKQPLPWQRLANLRAEDFILLRTLRVPKADAKGTVVDGSDRDPKFFRAPVSFQLERGLE